VKGSWAEERVELVEVDASIVCECEGERLSRMAYFLDHEAARTVAEADR
jgi:hypothetical protein